MTSPGRSFTRRRGDWHAIHIEDELDELRRRVDDLLLVARVVAVLVAGNGVLNVLDALA